MARRQTGILPNAILERSDAVSDRVHNEDARFAHLKSALVGLCKRPIVQLLTADNPMSTQPKMLHAMSALSIVVG